MTMPEAHDYVVDEVGQIIPNISSRPRRSDYKSDGAFGVALERWAHDECIRNRIIDKRWDAVDSGPPEDIIGLNELMKRLYGP